ncbi:MAG TPA: GLPGLI family protein [Faecalibacter sp.]
MKSKLFILLLHFSIFTFPQNILSIVYDHITNIQNINSFKRKSYLNLNESRSKYFIDFNNSYNDVDENILSVRSIKEKFYFKDYQNDSIYYDNTIIFKHFPTKDPINIFNWELSKQTKTILGFNCQRAVMRHYGRTYHAFFTTELGFTHGGPWKFDGLPGVILEVYSLDNEFKITATDIKLKNEKLDIENPYKNTTKFIDFKEFQRLYQQKYKEENKTIVNADGSTSYQSMPKCQIECLVD